MLIRSLYRINLLSLDYGHPCRTCGVAERGLIRRLLRGVRQFGKFWESGLRPHVFSPLKKWSELDLKASIDTNLSRNRFKCIHTWPGMTMGTHREIKIKTETPPTGAFEVRPFNIDTASQVSELLQRNHDNYHIYIHNLGLHSMNSHCKNYPLTY